jgi:ribose 5-phosphate isomerase A
MEREEERRAAARAALELVVRDTVLGVGSGRTVALFIDELARSPRRPARAVAASRASATLLAAAGVAVVELDDALPLELYVDGADEVDPALRLVKGRGGAHTREKVLASVAERFVCLVDESKLVARLGAAPVPVEVLPMARASAERALSALGGRPRLRAGAVTDNGALILDVEGLDLSDPLALEVALTTIPGVLECGIFARRPADLVFCGTADGVLTLRPPLADGPPLEAAVRT